MTYDLESLQNVPFRPFTSPVLAFDLDGTIIDSGQAVIDGILYALAQNSLPAPDNSRMREFIGPPIDHSLVHIGGVPPERLAAVKASYMEYFHDHGMADSYAYPELPGVLQKLADAGWDLAIVTSKSRPNALKVLHNVGLLDNFTAVFGTNLEHTIKVDILRIAVEHVQADGQPIVCLIGDRCFDFDAGNELNIPTLAVTWGYGNPEEYSTASATVNSAAELPAAIQKLAAKSGIPLP